MENRYADIVLPLAQPTYTFAVGEGTAPRVGDAVAVQFGAQAVYTGIVWRLHDTPPARGKAKPVLRVLYPQPLLDGRQMRLWEWIADYYMCSLGEVMRMALPSLVKPRARCEEEFEPYSPRREQVVRLVAPPTDEEISKIARRAPRQAALVGRLLAAEGYSLPRAEADADTAVIAALVRRGTVTLAEREVRPGGYTPRNLPELSPAQAQALADIRTGFATKGVALLHGVTGSGKTEIYMHLIAEALSRGGDVLYLVPEISLTTQLVGRLQRLFGERVVAYHSKLTPARRTKIYTDMLHGGGGSLIVGARSALFLPLRRTALVVVDEEHDTSYKQSEPAPRYNGRDTAIMLASLHGAKTLLGSATPSLESYANALAGKYAVARIAERYGGSPMPEITISDTIRAVKRGERKSHFNKALLDAIADRLAKGEQVMLFQNRRGYSPYIECRECGWSARCPHCNVTLTQHRHGSRLVCHYCGYSAEIPSRCPSCHTAAPEPMGFGTERAEEAIATLFPQARLLRLDGDTAASDAAMRRIVDSFARHEADILVGTQIISKGLDFDRVTLIGILNADNLLNAPDFRAGERAWQTIVQVAGRCGRRLTRGEVIVQTSDPSHPLLRHIAEGDYEAMAAAMLSERRMFSYPPYARIVRMTLRSTDLDALGSAAKRLGERLRARFGTRVCGPTAPLVDRVRGESRLEIVLKVEVAASFTRARALLREELESLRREREYRKVTVVCDVDVQ